MLKLLFNEGRMKRNVRRKGRRRKRKVEEIGKVLRSSYC